ncbi:uncharacterized protein GIQ15_01643 [Arthroderma uncinatum]|uniref:uncharacterized protein n=1 Tax=Arthroderma uncinatum TaxID=74035 RepID=UPI00144A6796|nr:uncharacterized protein GIQ15_01643 [Arthroderma uncinatum]KAF3492126.1 hypothetical protein GIQ15_01643 [Arthroderma uncinatum]
MTQTKKPTGQTADAPPSPPSSPTHEQHRKFSPKHPHSSPATTPPSGYYSSPCVPKFLTESRLVDALEKALLSIQKKSDADQNNGAPGPNGKSKEEAKQPNKPRIRASKLEYRTVEEVWDEKKYKYEISVTTEAPEVSELDEYEFVVRSRIDKHTTKPTVYIDVKSEGLRDILRDVLQDIKAVSLDAEMPSALFRPGEKVYSLYSGTDKPRAFTFDYGAERKDQQGVEFFHLIGHYFNFNSKVFGQVKGGARINYFPEAVYISKLKAFPLQYHPAKEDVEFRLRKCGKKFLDVMFGRHCHYKGVAFFEMENRKKHRVPINGRIMVDAHRFQQVNPGYPKLLSKISSIDLFSGSVDTIFTERVMSSGKKMNDLSEDNLLVFAPTMLGFSLDDKFWGEFAIENTSKIEWLDEPFNRLVIPPKKKDIMLAVTNCYLSPANEKKNIQFDDFIPKKGKGAVILLSGPPGVGKTLTAEVLAESKRRPLYSITTGQLSSNATELEIQLSEIFETTMLWGAVLLFDEADVYLTQRSLEHIERNRLVAAFLRTLEYSNGILFLTSNQGESFDQAISSRIHLTFKYDDLNTDARREVFRQFLRMDNGVVASVDDDELNALAQAKINGRQIKNAMSVAHALAVKDGSGLNFFHIRSVLGVSGHFVPEPGCKALGNGLYD